MDRLRDLCELARDVDESLESLIRFGASGELSILVIAEDWPVRSGDNTVDVVKGPVFLVSEDLLRSMNAQCTKVTQIRRPKNDETLALEHPEEVHRGIHFVTAEEAERFCREHALTLKSTGDTLPYLNPNHDFYSEELAIAVRAWVALFADGSFEKGYKTPRQHIERWLRAGKFDLDENAEQRIATLVNPKTSKKGGTRTTLAE
jgi:hypothetical protein